MIRLFWLGRIWSVFWGLTRDTRQETDLRQCFVVSTRVKPGERSSGSAITVQNSLFYAIQYLAYTKILRTCTIWDLSRCDAAPFGPLILSLQKTFWKLVVQTALLSLTKESSKNCFWKIVKHTLEPVRNLRRCPWTRGNGGNRVPSWPDETLGMCRWTTYYRTYIFF